MAIVQTLPTPDVVVPADAVVGEGPVWDHRTGHLVWVDILAGAIHETDLATGHQTTSTLDTLVGAAAPRAVADGFAVAVADGFGFFVDGTCTIADPVLPEPHRRMNDAKCDSSGRLWAGSNHMEFEPGAGSLHRWDGLGPSVVQRTGFTLPNGLGWSPDDRTMYLVDSMNNRLLRAHVRRRRRPGRRVLAALHCRTRPPRRTDGRHGRQRLGCRVVGIRGTPLQPLRRADRHPPDARQPTVQLRVRRRRHALRHLGPLRALGWTARVRAARRVDLRDTD